MLKKSLKENVDAAAAPYDQDGVPVGEVKIVFLLKTTKEVLGYLAC